MREIKFRAWDKKYNRLVEVTSIHFGDRYVTYDDLGHWSASFDDIVLMQNTGLKDKNGKEIYEGDIVKDEYNVGVVFYNEFRAMFGIDYITDNPSKKQKFIAPFDDWSSFEIIGNIYENPELLDNNK